MKMKPGRTRGRRGPRNRKVRPRHGYELPTPQIPIVILLRLGGHVIEAHVARSFDEDGLSSGVNQGDHGALHVETQHGELRKGRQRLVRRDLRLPPGAPEVRCRDAVDIEGHVER